MRKKGKKCEKCGVCCGEEKVREARSVCIICIIVWGERAADASERYVELRFALRSAVDALGPRMVTVTLMEQKSGRR